MYLGGQVNRQRPAVVPALDEGYAMVALLVSMSVMAIMMTVAMPVWKQSATREKEAELVFRGQQYVRALELFQRKSGPGTVPANLDVLIDQKFLRKKYKDPITGEDFALVSPNTPAAGQPLAPQGRGGPPVRGGAPGQPSAQGAGRSSQPGGTIGVQAGIVGVASKSKATSIRLYNGRSRYNEWQFVYVPRQQAPGAGGVGVGAPGQRGGPGQPQIPGVNGPAGRGGPGRGDGRGGRGDGRGGPPNQPPGGRGAGAPGGRGPGVQPFSPGGQPFGGQQVPQPRPPGN